MKHIFLILGLCISYMSALHAQEIINGTVIDEKNQPVPGARVEAVDRTEFSITDIDGLFRLEVPVSVEKITVSYVGYNSLTCKVKPNMVVKLNKGWWKTKPEEYKWFAGISYTMRTYSDTYGLKDNCKIGLGLMAGRVKNVGFYVKGFLSPLNITDSTDKYYWGLVGGGIFRLWSPIHIYIGGGYVYSKDLYTYNETIPIYPTIPDINRTEEFVNKGFGLDVGLLIRFKSFGINWGLTTVLSNEDTNSEIAQLGFSYFF